MIKRQLPRIAGITGLGLAIIPFIIIILGFERIGIIGIFCISIPGIIGGLLAFRRSHWEDVIICFSITTLIAVIFLLFIWIIMFFNPWNVTALLMVVLLLGFMVFFLSTSTLALTLLSKQHFAGTSRKSLI